MENSYSKIPDNYIQVREIDLVKNKKEFWLMNIGSLVLLIPFFVLYFFLETTIDPQTGLRNLFIVLLTIASFILVIIIHELIHGLFFKIFGKGKIKFGFHGFAVSCSMPTHYFNKKSFMIIGLAPFVIISVFTAILSIILYNTDYFLIAYAPLAINFSGSIGDIYVAFILLKYKKTILVQDLGTSMKFYDEK